MSHLVANSEYLNILFEYTREAVLLVNANMTIVAANPMAISMLDASQQVLTGHPIRKFLGRGFPAKGLRKSGSVSFICQGKKGRAKDLLLEIKAYPVRDENSWVILLSPVNGVAENAATELWNAEKIKTDALLDAIPDTIFILDFKGEFKDYLPATGKRLLPEEDAIKGRNMSEIFPAHVWEQFRKAIRKIEKEHQAQHLEFSIEDGVTAHYQARLVPMNDHRVLTIVQDISDRIIQKQALEDEQNRLKYYLDAAASMFVVLKPDFSIALVNQKVCDTTGFPRKTLVNQNWLTFLGLPEDRKKLRILFNRTMEGSSSLAEYFESHIRTREGGKRLIRWQNALLKDSAGNNTGLVCSGVDISDQKATEDKLRISESANKAILDAIPDVILLHDGTGRILSVQDSRNTSELFNRKRITGNLVTEIFPRGIGKQMLDKIQDTCSTGEARELEFTSKTSAGWQSFELRYVCMSYDRVLAVARDITKAKSTQKVLDLRNRALEAAGNGILIADARMSDMPVIYCNDAFTKITQYTRAEVLGKNCRFLQGRGTDPKKVAEIRSALDNGTSCNVVLRNYRKDGSLFWNELTITPIADSAGTLTHFIGVQNDISELMFEGARKDHTRRILEAITQDLPLKEISESIANFLSPQLPGLWIHLSLWQAHDQVLDTLACLGMPESLRSKLEHIELTRETQCPCAEAVKTKKTVFLPDLSAVIAPVGFIKTLKDVGVQSCWSYPILSSEKTVLGTCTFFSEDAGLPKNGQGDLLQDAMQLAGLAIERHQTRFRLEDTNRKLQAQAKILEKDVAARTQEVESTVQELLKSNKSLQLQIQTTHEAEERAMANQALFEVISKNFPKGVIMVFDRECRFAHLEGEDLDRIGLCRWDFIGKHILQTPGLSLTQRKKLETKIGMTLQGQHLSFEFKHGEHIYTVNSTPLQLSEASSWALLVFSNVTEQKKAEEDLLRALRIEQEINDLKSRFISMASHEFRTPLSAIHSSAILIGKQNEPGKEEKRLRYLRQIKTNVRNMVVILNDFLSLSKLEEGKISCQPVTFDVLEMIRYVLEELESNLKVGQHFTEDFQVTSLKVHLDQKLMRQILVNLLSNAIKYSPENSGIFIHIETEDDAIKISIKDEGIGIPTEEQAQLFNRFFRARNAVNIQGTGLGLHIVKHYVELMNGTISFKSEANKGSTFYIKLPKSLNPSSYEKDTDH